MRNKHWYYLDTEILHRRGEYEVIFLDYNTMYEKPICVITTGDLNEARAIARKYWTGREDKKYEGVDEEG